MWTGDAISGREDGVDQAVDTIVTKMSDAGYKPCTWATPTMPAEEVQPKSVSASDELELAHGSDAPEPPECVAAVGEGGRVAAVELRRLVERRVQAGRSHLARAELAACASDMKVKSNS